jgi:hypothetical protein
MRTVHAAWSPLQMHARFISAVIAIIASVPAANAADASGAGAGYGNSVYGLRTEPVIVYDYEPGVIVRTYWEPPWRNQHYFPSTGRRPKVGRLEHIPPHRFSRNEDYYRYWSASSIFIPEQLLPQYGQ